MTTIDELLKKSPPPWRVWDKANAPQGHCLVQDANGGAVHLGGSPQAICDAMSELARLRGQLSELDAFKAENATKLGEIHRLLAERDALRARNAELEAFAERMRGAPRRICMTLHTLSRHAFVYDVEGEDDEDAEEMCVEDAVNHIADEFRAGTHSHSIYGEGPLPWDEKGGGA